MTTRRLSSAPAMRPASPTRPPEAQRSSRSRPWTRTWAAMLKSATPCTQVSSSAAPFYVCMLLFKLTPPVINIPWTPCEAFKGATMTIPETRLVYSEKHPDLLGDLQNICPWQLRSSCNIERFILGILLITYGQNKNTLCLYSDVQKPFFPQKMEEVKITEGKQEEPLQ